jgi:predicted amidophosphoribosyltransferase
MSGAGGEQRDDAGDRTCINCGAALSPISRICASCGTLAGAPGPREPQQLGEQTSQPPEPEVQSAGQPSDPRRCGVCGAELGTDARFCAQCGAAAPLPAGEPPRSRFCTNCGAALAPAARFCAQCGVQVEPPAGSAAAAFGPYPLIFDVEYPEKLSRLLIFVKWPLVIPQLLVIYALGQVSGLIAFLAFFCILFTKNYPRGLFDLVVGFNRWGANVTAYTGLLRDEYPPFSTEAGRYPVRYDVDYPETLSRWLIWVKWFLVIPHYFVLSTLTIVALPVLLIAWFAILFTRRFPRGFFNFIVCLIRWNLRVGAYTGLMTDKYPPYSLAADAKPGGWKSIVIGVVVAFIGIAALIAGIVALASTSGGTKEVFVRYSALLNGDSSPLVTIDGTEVELLEAEDPYQYRLATAKPGERFVAFVFRIRNRDSIFTTISQDTFDLKDSSGIGHRPTFVGVGSDRVEGTLAEGEVGVVTVVFRLNRLDDPAELTYSPRLVELFGERVRFVFRTERS